MHLPNNQDKSNVVENWNGQLIKLVGTFVMCLHDFQLARTVTLL